LAREFRTAARDRGGGRAARAAARWRWRAAVGNLAVAVACMISATTRLRDAPATATPWLPPEAPLEMPVQDLRRGRLAGPRPPSTPPHMAWPRTAAFRGPAPLSLAVASPQLHE